MCCLEVKVVCTANEGPKAWVCCRGCKRTSPVFADTPFDMKDACYFCRLVKLMWRRAGFKDMRWTKTSAVIHPDLKDMIYCESEPETDEAEYGHAYYAV
jgi:hypothetical protein